MREIKFRFWNAQGLRFHYDQRQVLSCLTNQICGGYDYTKDDCAFEQFTGLRDKNGREIYEGDILAFDLQDYNGGDHLYRLPVVYRGAAFGFAIKSEPSIPDPDCWEDLDIVQAEDMELEVIGNIHETPELVANE